MKSVSANIIYIDVICGGWVCSQTFIHRYQSIEQEIKRERSLKDVPKGPFKKYVTVLGESEVKQNSDVTAY